MKKRTEEQKNRRTKEQKNKRTKEKKKKRKKEKRKKNATGDALTQQLVVDGLPELAFLRREKQQ